MRTFWVILVLLSEFIFYTEQISAICNLPKVQGLCKAYIQRYYFDKNSNQCIEFIYSGCGGNKNNFERLDECEETCMLTDDQSLESDQNNDVCSLPKIKGPCKARLNRYYFNKQLSECEDFEYGGCQGNGNNFLTLEECQNQCVSSDQTGLDDICNLPKEVGPCKASKRRYFYNTQSQKCEQFIFGGCRGNENNFMSLDECKIKCQSQDQILPTEDICHLPQKSGLCKAYIPRVYFNVTTGHCEDFVYGGCGGNENNFMNHKECQTKCNQKVYDDICKLPKIIGPCKATIPRHFYNSQNQQCESFNYGGCQGNDNNFDDLTECKSKCEGQDQTSNYKDICKLPKKKGPCKAILNRYYYNTNSQKCEKFIYGGCQGNENNFEDIFICQRTCEIQDQTSDNICNLPKRPGMCLAYFPRVYFNPSTGQCEDFIYGGCGGNANNFKDIEECQKTCPKKTTNICSLPQKSGPCYARFKRYYFNSKTHACEEFVWGGCQPNENNFESLDECRKACNPEESETDIEQSQEETDY